MKHNIEISLSDIPTDVLIKEVLSRKTKNVYTTCTEVGAIKIEINLKHADEFLIIHNRYGNLINNDFLVEHQRSELRSFADDRMFGHLHFMPAGCRCSTCKAEAIEVER